ncbi:MAG: IPT/TIG domain-containing protein [Candidatus Buchananbacteria bacterium]
MKFFKSKFSRLILTTVFLLGLSLVVGQFVLAQSTGSTGEAMLASIALAKTPLSTIVINAVNWFLSLLTLIAVIIIVYGGFVWMTARGNTDQIDKAKKILRNAAIGLVICLASWAIVGFVFGFWQDTSESTFESCTPPATQSCNTSDGCLGNRQCVQTEPGKGYWASCVKLSAECPGNYFAISDISPVDKSVGVIRNVVVRIKFNRIIDATTVTAGNIQILAEGAPGEPAAGVGGNFILKPTDENPQTVEFRPSAYCNEGNTVPGCFAANTTFEIAVSGIKGKSGETLDKAYRSVFTTGEKWDIGAPVVNIISPQNNANVYIDQNNEVRVLATDDSGLYKIELYQEDAKGEQSLISEQVGNNNSPLEATFSWNLSGYSAQQIYKLYAIAYDLDDNQKTSTAVAVITRPAWCNNGLLDDGNNNTTNHGETGVDCGGTSGCGACLGANCDINSQNGNQCDPGNNLCASNVCDVNSCLCVQPPVIDWLSPYNGQEGTYVTIGGRYFGSDIGKVQFIATTTNGTIWLDADTTFPNQCRNNNWQNNQIIVRVPAGLRITTNNPRAVWLKIIRSQDHFSATTTAPWFTVDQSKHPGICLVDPNSGAVKTNFDIYGEFTGTNRSITFGKASGQQLVAKPVSFSSASAGKGQVPSELALGTSYLYALIDNVYSNAASYKVKPTLAGEPEIIEFSPISGGPGTYVTIFGSNFSNSRDGGKVLFGGVEANYTFPAICQDSVWQNNMVIVKVPTGATTGIITLIRSDQKQATTDGLSPKVFEINNVVKPGICKILPNQAAPGYGNITIGEHQNEIYIFGDNFSTNKGEVIFYNNQSVTPASFTWGNQVITNVKVPLKATTGKVKVKNSNDQISNGYNFTVNSCNQNSECDNGQECCAGSSYYAGSCRATGQCEISAQACWYSFDFWTKGTNFGPKILCDQQVACLDGKHLPSPTPWLGWQEQGKETYDACVNAVVSLTFTGRADAGTVNSGTVKVYKCNDGKTCVNTTAINPAADYPKVFVTEGNDEQVEKKNVNGESAFEFLPSADFTVNTWYKVIVSGEITDEQGHIFNRGNDYSWQFKTTTSTNPDFCQFGCVETQPDPFTAYAKERPIDYFAFKRATKNVCTILNATVEDAGNKWSPWDATWDGSDTKEDKVNYTATTQHIQNSVLALDETNQIPVKLEAALPVDKKDSGNLFIDFSHPFIIEQENCNNNSLQSPSPYSGSKNACTNALVYARFNTLVKPNTLPANNAENLSGNIIFQKQDINGWATASVVPKTFSLTEPGGDYTAFSFDPASNPSCEFYNSSPGDKQANCQADSNCGWVANTCKDKCAIYNTTYDQCLTQIKSCSWSTADGKCHNSLMEPGTYRVIIRGGDNGVLSTRGGKMIQLNRCFDFDNSSGSCYAGSNLAISGSGYDANSCVSSKNCNAYVWEFTTKSACDVSAVRVDPKATTANFVGQPKTFYGKTIAANCNQLSNNPLAWDWSLADNNFGSDSYAVASGATNLNSFIALAKNQTPVGSPVKVNTVYDNNGKGLPGQSLLTIKFTGLWILENWPNCDLACINAVVGARFSENIKKTSVKVSNPSNIDSDNVLLYKCADANCNLSTVAPVPTILNEPIGELGTILQIEPANQDLIPETFYRVLIKGGSQGIKSFKDTELKGLNFSTGGLEECDDSNNDNGDGCSNICLREGNSRNLLASGNSSFEAWTGNLPNNWLARRGSTVSGISDVKRDGRYAVKVVASGTALSGLEQFINISDTSLAGKTVTFGVWIYDQSRYYSTTFGGSNIFTHLGNNRSLPQADGQVKLLNSSQWQLVLTVPVLIKADTQFPLQLNPRIEFGEVHAGDIIYVDQAFIIANYDANNPGDYCGDGKITGYEECEAPDEIYCSNTCLNLGSTKTNQTVQAICGNGKVEVGEDCDDSNIVSGDGCRGTEDPTKPGCVWEGATNAEVPYKAFCNNNTLDYGEECSPNLEPWKTNGGCDANTCLLNKANYDDVYKDCKTYGKDGNGKNICDIILATVCNNSTSCSGTAYPYGPNRGNNNLAICGNGKIEFGEDCDGGSSCLKCQNIPGAYGGSCGDGQLTQNNSYSWVFKTKKDLAETPDKNEALCDLAKVQCIPLVGQYGFIGEKLQHSSRGWGKPDQCSPVGQEVSPRDYLWQWTSDDYSKASILNIPSSAYFQNQSQGEKEISTDPKVYIKNTANPNTNNIVSCQGDNCCQVSLACGQTYTAGVETTCPGYEGNFGCSQGICKINNLNYQTCTENNDCAVLVGSDTCCHLRPYLATTTPSGAHAACPNGMITATFSELMDKNTINVNNVELRKCGYGLADNTSANKSTSLFAKITNFLRNILAHIWPFNHFVSAQSYGCVKLTNNFTTSSAGELTKYAADFKGTIEIFATSTANSATNLVGGWSKLNLPLAYQINNIFASPRFSQDKTLYLASSQGLYRSSDAGINWEKTGTGLPSTWSGLAWSFSTNFASDHQIITAVGSALYLSENNGSNFSKLPFINTNDVKQVLFSPNFNTDKIIIVSDVSGNIFKSTNGGQSWQKINNYSGNTFTAIAINFDPTYSVQNKTIWALVRTGGNSYQIYNSSDIGNIWVPNTDSIAGIDPAGWVIAGNYSVTNKISYVYGRSNLTPFVYQVNNGNLVSPPLSGLPNNGQILNVQAKDNKLYVLVQSSDATKPSGVYVRIGTSNAFTRLASVVSVNDEFNFLTLANNGWLLAGRKVVDPLAESGNWLKIPADSNWNFNSNNFPGVVYNDQGLGVSGFVLNNSNSYARDNYNVETTFYRFSDGGVLVHADETAKTGLAFVVRPRQGDAYWHLRDEASANGWESISGQPVHRGEVLLNNNITAGNTVKIKVVMQDKKYYGYVNDQLISTYDDSTWNESSKFAPSQGLAGVYLYQNSAAGLEGFANFKIFQPGTITNTYSSPAYTLSSYDWKGQTVVKIIPNTVLDYSQKYEIAVGDVAEAQKPVSAAGIRFGSFTASQFTTSNKVCSLAKVEVEVTPGMQGAVYQQPAVRSNDSFFCSGNNCQYDVSSSQAGNQHQYRALAKDSAGNELMANYSWLAGDPNQVIKISGSSRTQSLMVTANNTNGQADLRVVAATTQAPYESKQTSLPITVFMCNNPWPSPESFPWVDQNSNCTVNKNNCSNYNFATYYCRDLASAGTADDLPALSYLLRGREVNDNNELVANGYLKSFEGFTTSAQSSEQSFTPTEATTKGADIDIYGLLNTSNGAQGCGTDDACWWSFDNLNITQPGVYQLQAVTSNGFTASMLPQDLSARNIYHDLKIEVDGKEVGTIKNLASYPQQQAGNVVLGSLAVGNHTLKVTWLNDYEEAGCAVATRSDCSSNVILHKLSLALQNSQTDVIGWRVYSNSEHLSPQLWYKKYAPNPAASVSTLTVDGYQAVKGGNTLYANVANLTGRCTNDGSTFGVYCGTTNDCLRAGLSSSYYCKYNTNSTYSSSPLYQELFTNIYLLTVSQGASSATQNIHNQLINNLQFNSNVSNQQSCQAESFVLQASLEPIDKGIVRSVQNLVKFNNRLFATAAITQKSGGEIYRLTNNLTNNTWQSIYQASDSNSFISKVAEFKGALYAGLGNTQAQLVKSDSQGTNWSVVKTFGANDKTVNLVTAFNSALYVSTDSLVDGAKLYRSTDGTTWNDTSVISAGFGDSQNINLTAASIFKDQLYLGTSNVNGGQIWRTADGQAWQQVVGNTGVLAGGFGNKFNDQINTLAVYKDYLYAGTHNNGQAELWRTANGTTWEKVNVVNLATSNIYINSLQVVGNDLFFGTNNGNNLAEVWRTQDGTVWEKIAPSADLAPQGLGSNAAAANALFADENNLWVGTYTKNQDINAEIWQLPLESLTVKTCSSNLDCASNICLADKSKIRRDMARMMNFGDLTNLLYKQQQFPDISGGSFLRHYTTSVWGSWSSELSNILSTAVAKDPLNKVVSCPTGVCLGNHNLVCSKDQDCLAASATCVGGTCQGSSVSCNTNSDCARCALYDQNTCFNSGILDFRCTDSYLYLYHYTSGQQAELYARFEYPSVVWLGQENFAVSGGQVTDPCVGSGQCSCFNYKSQLNK